MTTESKSHQSLAVAVALAFWNRQNSILAAGEAAKGLAVGLGAGLLAGAAIRIVLTAVAVQVGMRAEIAVPLASAGSTCIVALVAAGQLVQLTRDNSRRCESPAEFYVRLRRDVAGCLGSFAGAVFSGAGLQLAAAALAVAGASR